MLSPVGKLLTSADAAGHARPWNWATGLPAGAPIRARAPNGVLVVPVWNWSNGLPADASVPAGAPSAELVVPFGPDGKLSPDAADNEDFRLWQVMLAAHPYAALCVYVGPPTRQEWDHYAPGERQPKVCR